MKDLSIYVHIPFCKSICLYCNFVTFAHKNKKIPLYIEGLCQEIQIKSRKFSSYTIETVYFGGGTPSLIDALYIEKILQTLRKFFQLQKNLEITIECNPESLTLEKILYYKKIGINRISLGIQSFEQKTLHRIARPHNATTILKTLEVIKKSNFKNFGTDFIIGLPYQTLSSFKQEVKKILAYQPPHLSFYFLSYDTKRIDLFKKDCPSEEEQIAMYEYLTKILAKNNYHHYEVSNYAKPSYECRHNQRYWQQKDYLGFGVGAHSIAKNKSWENESDFEQYLQNPLSRLNEMSFDAELKQLNLHGLTSVGLA